MLTRLITGTCSTSTRGMCVVSGGSSVEVRSSKRNVSCRGKRMGGFLGMTNISQIGRRRSVAHSKREQGVKQGNINGLTTLSISRSISMVAVDSGRGSNFILSHEPVSKGGLQPVTSSSVGFMCVRRRKATVMVEGPRCELGGSVSSIGQGLLGVFPLIGSGFGVRVVENGRAIAVSAFSRGVTGRLYTFVSLKSSFSSLTGGVPGRCPTGQARLIRRERPCARPVGLGSGTKGSRRCALGVVK